VRLLAVHSCNECVPAVLLLTPSSTSFLFVSPVHSGIPLVQLSVLLFVCTFVSPVVSGVRIAAFGAAGRHCSCPVVLLLFASLLAFLGDRLTQDLGTFHEGLHQNVVGRSCFGGVI
jgi:hypothetical protein